jgi:serine/threonine-protein kinase
MAIFGWFRQIFGLDEAPEEAPPSPPDRPPSILPPATSEPLSLQSLRSLGTTDEVASGTALSALRSLAGGPHERMALEVILRAARRGAVAEDLRVEAAGLHLQRGELDSALALLDQPSSLAGLALRADVLAARGDLPAACAALERVLARDIQAPGVLERLDRWRSKLGVPTRALAPEGHDATLFTAAQPTTPFRIVAEAGRGGAAVIYEARDDSLGRAIALKIYHRPSDSREQMEREALVAAQVAGPGVVRVLDASLDEGWLALEWARGGTLRDAIRRGERARLLPVSRWLEPLVAGLARAHAAGWAHGDIKPGNVLLLANNTPLLADFGLARQPGEPWSGGTPGYLSPERIAGRTASLSDDVYALGRLLDDVRALVGDEAGPDARDLLELCLGEGRPTSAEALLGHPALRGP